MTFLLVSAHDPAHPLAYLLKELDSINESLRPLAERQILNVELKLDANNQDIINTFSRLAGKIEVFHFSGHANGKRLGIKGGGHIIGISELFGSKNTTSKKSVPKLVFLNGCGTSQQISELHQEGVDAVISTYFPIEDHKAYLFATSFYAEWVKEGTNLETAFEFAKAALHTLPEYAESPIQTYRDTGSLNFGDERIWGLCINPALNEEEQAAVCQFQINPSVLPPLVLKRIQTASRESLRELAWDFSQSMRNKKQGFDDPILALIERFPWIIGTHLRRLFAQTTINSDIENDLLRLKDIDFAYGELLRFIRNILTALLWDQQNALVSLDKKKLPVPFLKKIEANKADHLYSIRQLLAILEEIDGDPIEMEVNVKKFLAEIDGAVGLVKSHNFMAELHLALHDSNPARLDQLLIARYDQAKDYQQICLDAELIYANFLRAALFLKDYRLVSVWSISVDRFKFIDTQEPFSYKIIDLHGAFGDVQPYNSYEEQFGDSYCIILIPRKTADETLNFSNALNLSPFYIDKTAFLENRSKSGYPLIFALQHQEDSNSFLYTCIDRDRNFKYQSTANHEIVIERTGAKFPEVLEITYEESQKFSMIYQQLIRLHSDFSNRA